MSIYFISSNDFKNSTEVNFASTSPLESYTQLLEALRASKTPRLYSLLAQPVISRSNGVAATSAAWYTDIEGDARRLIDLDTFERKAAEDLLRERLQAFQVVAAASPVGGLLATALYIPNLSCVFVVAGEPVLTNWAVLPTDIAADPAARGKHFTATLGRYLPDCAAPATDPAGFERWRTAFVAHQDAAPKVVESPESLPLKATQTAAADISAMTTPTANPQDETITARSANQLTNSSQSSEQLLDEQRVPREPWYSRPWLPGAAALSLLLLILLILLIPGVLLYPEQHLAAGPASNVNLQREINEGLQRRIQNLQLALEQNVCTPEGHLVGPDGRTPQGVLPQDLEPGSGPVAAPGTSDALLPPPPEALEVTPPSLAPPTADHQGQTENQPAQPRQLVELLDETTLLVLALGDNGTGLGSGYFIAPNRIVTNLHVIENADPKRVFVMNNRIGRLKNVQVLRTSASSNIGTDDFALLSADFGPDQPFLELSPSIDRLENVIAAGFPGLINATDVNFQALSQGDLTAAPQTAFTSGIVTVIHTQRDGLPIIAHTATISPGNSGGPLLDSCGRVVGTNTFTRTDNQTAARANYALHNDRLLRFLEQDSTPYSLNKKPCQPRVSTPQRPEPTTQPKAPKPSAAEPTQKTSNNETGKLSQATEPEPDLQLQDVPVLVLLAAPGAPYN